MGSGGAGGGVIVAIAAVLWLVYLMPSWYRRRQYLATERNAVRLQQTIRVLAETSEVPETVRAQAEAVSLVEQHRALKQAALRAESLKRANDAAAARAMSRSQEAPQEPRQKAVAVAQLAASRLRRTRLAATGVLAASGVGLVFGVIEMVLQGSWILLVAAVVTGLASIGFLQRVATVVAARRATEAVDRTVTVSAPVQSFVDWQRAEPERPSWTPVPLPKPLYLSRREETPAASVAVSPSLRAMAHLASEGMSAAETGVAPEVAQLPVRREQPAASGRSGYAAMGVVGETSPGITDLNDVLRRRRAG